MFIPALALLFSAGHSNAQAPSYQWVNEGYPAPGIFPPQVVGTAIAIDAAGNSFVTGTYAGRTLFGSGSDTIPVFENSAGSDDNGNTYLAKYDNAGKILWVRTGEVRQHYAGFNYGSGVAVDAAGNSYIAGTFHDSTNIGGTVLTTVSNNHSGCFIAKYDASGNLIWAKKGGSGDMYAAGIAVDASGNSYLSGQMSYNGTIAGNAFSNSFFVSKYDTNGDPVWAVGNQNNCFGNAIACSGSSVFVTGYYYGTPSFGSTTLADPVAANTHFFVVKLDLSGAYVWAQGNTSTDVHTTSNAYSVAADNSGNCFVAGTYSSEMKFGTTDVLSGTATQTNSFLLKYNSSGAEQWAKSFISTNGDGDFNNAVCTDNSGNAYITGSFAYTTNFGASTLSSPPGSFAAKFNPSGTNLWATYAGGTFGKAIAANAGGVNFTGKFQYSATFGTLTVSNPGFFPAMYIARLSDATGVNDLSASGYSVSVYPNPATADVTIALNKEIPNGKLEVMDVAGKLIYSSVISTSQKINLATTGWANGIYFVKIADGTSAHTEKLIISGN